MELAKKTKATRERLNLSQKELAEEIGTNQTTISFIERGFIPKQVIVDCIEKIYDMYMEEQ